VFENRALGRIFGPKREEVTRRWRRLHNEELYNLYISPNIIKVMRWEGYVARMKMTDEYKILVGKPEGKRPLGRPRRRWEDNMRMEP
jgi:hypothetical protein